MDIREVIPSYDKLPDLLDPEQTAQLLGLEMSTLAKYRCVGRGEIPYIKICRRIKYPKKLLADWIMKNLHGGKRGA